MQTNQGDLSASRTPKCWGPKRLVEVPREPGQSLGISIVGGKVEMSGGSTVDGIFIKNVIPSSPAGRTGGLSTGDRIVEVDGYPLLSSDQEDAVKAISNAKTPLRLMVQSLIQQKSVDNKGGINKNNNNNLQHSQDDYRKGKAPSKLIIPNIFFNPANGPTNGPTTNGFSSSGASSERGSSRGISSRNGKEFANNNNSKPTSARKSSISPSSPEVRDNYSYSYAKTGDGPLPGNCVVTNLADLKPGDASSMRSDWSRTSSPPPEPELIQSGLTDQEKFIINTKIDFAKRDKERGNRDDDKNEDPVECTIVDDKIVERKPIRSSSIASMKSVDGGMVDEDGDIDMEEEATWSKMDGEIIKAVVEQNEYGLGLSLAGHKDRETMRTFICGIHPRGKAHQLDLFKPGDQLLKVGDSYVGDRCHLNVTSMIKSYSNLSSLEVVVLRPRGQSCVAVKEVTQFPLLLDDMIFESPEFSSFLAKRELRVHKGKQGLGIMIIEGNHKATGNGIFVSDIQEQSAAFHAGLKVGDMILAINTETFLHISYDQAVSVIKGLGGNVKLLVTNPKEEEERKNNAGKAGTDSKLGDAKAGAAAGKSPAKPDPKDKKDVKPVDTKPKEEKKGKVDLKKEKNSFGLGLVGGSDTPLGEILIHEVFPDSPAAKSNVLKPGFRINKINETELKNMTHEAAMEVLRSAQDKVTLHFEKREGGDEVDLFQKIDITLNRKANKGLGISLVGRRDGPGVFVSALVPGSLAETSGLLTQGDQIIKVNDIDLEKANQDTAVAVMKSTTGDIKITVKRLNAISKS